MAAAMGAFSVEDAFFKRATQDIATSQALMMFGAMGLAVFALLSLRRKEPIWHPQLFSTALILRSVSELIGRLFFALALALTPLTSASAILQAAPLVVVIGAVVFFGERVGWRRWLAIGLGLVGVLLIIRPTPQLFELTSVFAVLATLGFAGRDLATRASPATMSTEQLGSLGFAILVIAGVLLSFIMGESLTTPTLLSVGATMGATAAGVLAYSALTLAMRTGEISIVTPFRYTRQLFAIILGFAVFGEWPDLLTWAGIGVIILSGLYTARAGRQDR
ncbi:DMT family transporter [Donghicola sp.]|jgi:drug/metabolite transporter (DMT)-like permease|uniref:DMT family transporter n=1 Tax=Donghicola sp. TaxID=1929294 RepID=UPI0025F1F79C|nr:DMT family transporter [Donghicola sp.]MCT4578064.1 DMT family transporter [Donghicola sp.]